MSRAKRGFKLRRRHNKLRKLAEGYVMGSGAQIRRTSEVIDRAGIYAYRDRRRKKREFRGLWIARLGAAASENGISYSRLIAALKKAEIQLDRKVLSEIAIADPRGFTALIDQVKSLAPTA